MLNVGIIGAGGIIERRHLPGLLETPDVARVCALSDISAERVDLLAERSGVATDHRYTDYRVLLANEDLDIVVIGTPVAHHEAPVVEAAGRVRAILVEKPIAVDLASTERMVDACRGAGTQLSVVHNQLHRPAVETAKELLDSGELGRPYIYRHEWLGSSHRVGSGAERNWRLKRVHGGGGCMLDYGYHVIYLAEHLLGERVTSVQAQVGTLAHDIDVEDTVFVTMRHENGAFTSFQCGWSIVAGLGAALLVNEIHASGGSIRFDHQGAPVAVIRPGDDDWDTPDVPEERPDDAGFFAFMQGFLSAVEAGAPPPISGEEACHIMAVIDAAYESARTGMAVEPCR